MIAVIFEVIPAPGRMQSYLDHAASLRPDLERMEGFHTVERFQSLSDPNKLISLSFFEDEAALSRWRNRADHWAAQCAGRSGVFAEYRLRIAEVIRDYGLHDREQAPDDSRAVHATAGS